MTRKEEIFKASADTFNEYGYELTKTIKMFWLSAFIDGAKWADEHPKNIWHEPSEEPQNKPFRIICQDDWGNVEVVEDDVVKFVYQGDWEAYVKDNCIIRWAYISDLLPKGGEK